MDGLIKLLIDNKDCITFFPRVDWMQVQAGIPSAEAGIDFERGGNMQICGRNASAVVWLNGNITRALAGGRDLISFDFDGCTMAAYRKLGVWYVVHIHCASAGTFQIDRRLDFARYVNGNPITRLIMFKPFVANYQAGDELVWGVITREGNCYTVVVVDKTPNLPGAPEYFELHAIWQHRAPSNPTFYQRIMRPQWALLTLTPATHAFVSTRWNKFLESQRDELIFTRVLDP